MSPRRDPLLPQGALDRLKHRLNGWLGGGPPSRVAGGQVLRHPVRGARRHLNVTRLLLLAAAGWVFYTLIAGEHGLLRIRHLEQEKAGLDMEILTLRNEVELVRDHVRENAGDPYHLEKIARERYGLVRPGETVYRFRQDETSVTKSPGGTHGFLEGSGAANGGLDNPLRPE